MNKTAFFTPAAKQDLALARDWYEGEKARLGFELVDEVRNATNRLESNPDHFAIVHRDARLCPVKRFPFFIVFRLVEERPEILAVLHGHRDPTVWRNRIQ